MIKINYTTGDVITTLILLLITQRLRSLNRARNYIQAGSKSNCHIVGKSIGQVQLNKHHSNYYNYTSMNIM